jgi:ribonuclease HI
MDIYTDGSCTPNPGRGGWAYVIPRHGIEKSGYVADTTNNRMELMAIREALKDPTDPQGTVVIYTDSQLCIYTITGKWKSKKNRDLILECRALIGDRKVTFTWVRGHNGNKHNERCDFLANKAAWSG